MTKPVGDRVIYPELSFQLMEIAFEIHNQLGPGFGEEIYQKAFEHELAVRSVPFERQKTIQVVYKGQLVGTYRLDLVVDNKIIVELKAVAGLNDLFKQQLRSYLKATGLRLGILINFGAARVQSGRIAN
jgi:GxxExxY protein